MTIQVRELPGEQPGGLKASGHSAFLDQAESAFDHAVVLRPVHPRELMVDRLFPAQAREGLVDELGAVVRKHLTSPPTSARNYFVAEATSAALLLLRGYIHPMRVASSLNRIRYSPPPRQTRSSWGRQGQRKRGAGDAPSESKWS